MIATMEYDKMAAGLEAIILAIVSVIGTIFGGQWIWKTVMNSKNKDAGLALEAQKHEQDMEKAKAKSLEDESTKSEKILKDIVKKMEAQLQKHEERLNALEAEKVTFMSTIALQDGELKGKDAQIKSLRIKIDKMIKVMEDHSVEQSIVELFKE